MTFFENIYRVPVWHLNNAMCGIYGITTNNRKFVEDYIELCDHRGPDGRGVWNDDHVTIGHNLLSITDDPDASRQPYVTPKGNILSYNGEIFNYDELCEKFTEFKPRTKCDTELLAWGLDRQGLDFIEHIDSQHAFAYYQKDSKRLTLSRDHAGIKPLYYKRVPEGLAFGSEIKGLSPSREVDIEAMSCFAYAGVNALPNTFHKDVRQLLPGETIVYDCVARQFQERTRQQILPTNDHEFDGEEFRHRLHSVVRNATLGQQKIAVCLSGGLDSTTIAHELMRTKGEVNAFSCEIKPGPLNDDYVLARQLAESRGYDFTRIATNPYTTEKHWRSALLACESPMMSEDIAMEYQTNLEMARQGVVVVLKGGLGDETMAGYNHYLRTDWRQVRHASDVWRVWLNRDPQLFHHPALLSQAEVAELLSANYGAAPDSDDPLNSYMALDCVTLAQGRFMDRGDKIGMAHSLESRYPYASKQWMRYAFSIPSRHKIAGGVTKALTREAYRGLLPDSIVDFPKRGWDVPTRHWLQNNAGFQRFHTHSVAQDRTGIQHWTTRDWIHTAGKIITH